MFFFMCNTLENTTVCKYSLKTNIEIWKKNLKHKLNFKPKSKLNYNLPGTCCILQSINIYVARYKLHNWGCSVAVNNILKPNELVL